jgi:asparagine synthase (glutamine-hydrolysing)
LGRLLALDTATYLVDDLLVKVDIASMANSLEARSPFLDHKLMEFAASLPEEYKIKFFSKKHILKKAIRGILPDENIFRKKMGFGIPLGRWFRTELKGILCETLLSERSLKRGYFKPEAIRMAVQKHISGAADYSRQLWAIFMLELWHRRFIDHA